MRSHWYTVGWSCLVLAVMLGAPALAADPDSKHEIELPFISEILQQPTDLDVNDLSLADFASLLGERYHIPVMLDRATLEEAGVPLDSIVSCHLKGVALRSVISWALAGHAMDWLIEEDVLLLTTRNKADNTRTTMVHDVSDFIAARDEKEEADAVMKRLQQLTEVLEATVLPDSWKSAGGDGTIKPLEIGSARVLVVYQNRYGHEAVALVIDDLAFCATEGPLSPPKSSSGAHTKVTSFKRPRAR